MFGAAAFSEFAFSEQDHVEADSSAFKAFLAQITAQRCWLLEIEALSLAVTGGVSSAFSDAAFSQVGFGEDAGVGAGGPVALRYSTHGYTDVRKGYALQFDGVNRHVTCGNLSAVPTNGPASIEWWPRFDQFAIAKGANIGINTQLYQHIANNYFYLGGGGADYFGVGATLQLGVSYHMVLTYNGTHENSLLYINGVQYPVTIQTVNIGHAALDPFRISDTNFPGVMDGARVYTRELSATEVAEHYNGIYRDETGLVGRWDFDEGEGASATDTSGNGNHGALINGPTWVPGAYNGDEDRHWYDGRIAAGITVERRIIGRDGIGGLSRVFAEVSLVNRDGGLDNLMRDYALDGRRATLLIGPPDGARSEYGVVFTGVVERMSAPLARLMLQLSDGLARLDRAVNNTAYAGTGGLEGGADLTGKPKPKCHGKVFNIAPPMVDSLNLIYQVHDGAIKDVPAVRDRGVALAKVGGAPAAGQYQVDTAAGTFKLGATPAGTVTADVEGDASSPGYVDRTADIVLRLLAPVLNSSEINPTSFAMLNDHAPAAVGIWIGTEPRSIAEAVDELLAAIGAFGGFSRSGAFAVGVVSAPAGTPKSSFTEQDITGLEREPLPGAVDPAVWRALVGYQKNYTVQNDFAASVPAAQRTFAVEPVRVASKEDAAIQSRRLLARDYGPSAGTYVNQADADTEAQRRLDLWGAPRAPFRVTTRPAAMLLDLGDVVEIQHRRFGLQNSAAGRVLRHKIADTQVELGVLT